MRSWGIIALWVLAACSSAGSEAEPDAGEDSCPLGFEDCNGDPTDGCEADLTSPTSCGGCVTECTAPSEATPTCNSGSCDFECRAGKVRCDDDCLDECPFVFTDVGMAVFEAPLGCERVRISAWGAGGGNGRNNANAAAGGFAQAEIVLAPAETLTLIVGAPGQDSPGQGPGIGGEPGGGSGGSSNSQGGGGGGGYSGVFRGSPAQATAVLIAGGGAGSGGGNGSAPIAGAGGGADGQAGSGGAGATQSTGFGPLLGGTGGSQGSGDGGGGGGGGWFGGQGGSGANQDAFGGGGGSAFAAPTAEAVDLQVGDRATAGNATHPDRGTAGDPTAAGAIFVSCIPGVSGAR